MEDAAETVATFDNSADNNLENVDLLSAAVTIAGKPDSKIKTLENDRKRNRNKVEESPKNKSVIENDKFEGRKKIRATRNSKKEKEKLEKKKNELETRKTGEVLEITLDEKGESEKVVQLPSPEIKIVNTVTKEEKERAK